MRGGPSPWPGAACALGNLSRPRRYTRRTAVRRLQGRCKGTCTRPAGPIANSIDTQLNALRRPAYAVKAIPVHVLGLSAPASVDFCLHSSAAHWASCPGQLMVSTLRLPGSPGQQRRTNVLGWHWRRCEISSPPCYSSQKVCRWLLLAAPGDC